MLWPSETCSSVMFSCLPVLLISLCLYCKLFLAAPGTVNADLWLRLQVHSNTTNNNGGNLTRGNLISSLDPMVSTSINRKGDRYCVFRGPPLSTAGLVTVAENRGCPQPQTASLSSRIWSKKRAFPPSACCSSGGCLSPPSLKRDSVPRWEVIALETSLNICVQSDWTSTPGVAAARGRASAVARSLGRGCIPDATAPEGVASGEQPPRACSCGGAAFCSLPVTSCRTEPRVLRSSSKRQGL